MTDLCPACDLPYRAGHVDPCLGFIPGARFACCGHELLDEWDDDESGESVGQAYVCAFRGEFPEVLERFRALLRRRVGRGVFLVRVTFDGGLDGDLTCAHVARVRGEVDLRKDDRVWSWR